MLRGGRTAETGTNTVGHVRVSDTISEREPSPPAPHARDDFFREVDELRAEREREKED